MSALRTFLAALLTVLSLVWAAPLAAQSNGVEAARVAAEFERWQQVAQRAEAAIDAGRASDAALEAVRTELARFRQLFVIARDANAERIRTIHSQIDALGPAPVEGETEATDIATRRATLNAQLADLRAPGLAAEEAFKQADGLIGEIDQTLAQRRANALLSRGPSPLHPVLWPEAVRQLSSATMALSAEARRNWSNEVRQTQMRDNLPATLALALLGMVLILRGRTWAFRTGIICAGTAGAEPGCGALSCRWAASRCRCWGLSA